MQNTQLLPATKTLAEAQEQGYAVVRGRRWIVWNHYFLWCVKNQRVAIKIHPKAKYASVTADLDPINGKLSDKGQEALAKLLLADPEISRVAWSGESYIWIRYILKEKAARIAKALLDMLADPENTQTRFIPRT